MSKERFCPECGQPVNADERFCPDCVEVPFETHQHGIPEGPLNKVKPSDKRNRLCWGYEHVQILPEELQNLRTTMLLIHPVSITLPRSITTRRLSWRKKKPSIVRYVEIL